MRLGIVLSRFPYPLEKGDKLRAFYQIQELSKTHEIYLCTINVGNVDEYSLKQLEPYCKEIKVFKLSKISILINLAFSLFLSKLPMQVAYFYNRKAKKQIHNFFKNKNIEHLFCQLIRVAEYVKDYKHCPKTLDYMDALSQGMERRIDKASFYLKPFVRIESTRLKRYEHFIFSSFNHKIIISEQDRELIVHAKNNEIEIVRNGVNEEYFKPQNLSPEFELLFTGNMSYPPNIDGVSFLVDKILPLVWKTHPNVRLVIAGANPSQSVQKLASDRIKVTGWVDDMREYYAKTKIFIAPMQIGTGLQNKLLEAMSMNIPCITSPLANNALQAIDGESILIGDKPIEYKEQIVKLLDNQDFANKIAKNGKLFITKNYNWENSTKTLNSIFLNHGT
ncbi:MAG: glycosyltransferase [Flavobacteriales bacterium]|nr:glycosyltransferase [Flavobacteriales bacterium]